MRKIRVETSKFRRRLITKPGEEAKASSPGFPRFFLFLTLVFHPNRPQIDTQSNADNHKDQGVG